jgi:uncharacterized protein YuzE
MKIVKSVGGVLIRLTPERLEHIERRHPEMLGEEKRILEVVSSPHYVQEGDSGTLLAVRHYARTPLTEKHCAVVYRELTDEDPFCLNGVFHNQAVGEEKNRIEAVKLFDKKKAPVDWEYDGEADTLYITFGKPRRAVGVDVGEGVVVRYDEKAKEVVGLTIIGVGRRLEQHLKQEA